MNRLDCMVALVLGIVIATGCGTKPEPVRRIAYSALDMKNPFFKVIADTLTSEAAAHGFEVVVTDADNDVQLQSKQVDNFIAQQVTAIVLSPADREAIAPAIRKATQAGIPVFTCDLQCVAEDVEIAGHVGTDNFQGGQLAGQAMIEALGETGGKVLILHKKEANSCVLRVDGFRDVIDTYNRDRQEGLIDIVLELDGGGTTDKGFRSTSDAIQTHGDLAGIFAINDPSAKGAWTALQQVQKTDQVKIIGFDGQPEGKQAIKDGKFVADPIQFPDRMAEITVENIVKFLDGQSYEKEILLPTQLYTKEQADADPELQ